MVAIMWFLGLSLLEIAFVAVFFIALCVGAGADRRGREEPKWYILGVGFVVAAVWFWPEYSFFGPADIPAILKDGKVVEQAVHRIVLWDVISHWSFWTPLAMFLCAGLLYSLVEFVMEVRRMARSYAERWATAIDRKIEVFDLNDDGSYKTYPEPDSTAPRERGAKIRTGYVSNMLDVKSVLGTVDTNPGNAKAAKEFIGSFIAHNGRPSHSFIGLTENAAGTAPEPKIDKITLAQSLGAWTFMWPAYLLSLILGDLLTEVFATLTDFLVHVSGRFVKMSFANAFRF